MNKKYEIYEMSRIINYSPIWKVKDVNNNFYESQIITFPDNNAKNKFLQWKQRYEYVCKEIPSIQNIVDTVDINDYQTMLIFELPIGENLSVISFNSKEKIIQISLKIIDIVEQLHFRGINHGKLCAENIFVKGDIVQITGFEPKDILKENIEEDINKLEKIIKKLKDDEKKLTKNSVVKQTLATTKDDIDYREKNKFYENKNTFYNKELKNSINNIDDIFSKTDISKSASNATNKKINFLYIPIFILFLSLGYGIYPYLNMSKNTMFNFSAKDVTKHNALEENYASSPIGATQKNNSKDDIRKINKSINNVLQYIVKIDRNSMYKNLDENSLLYAESINLTDMLIKNNIVIKKLKYEIYEITDVEEKYGKKLIQANIKIDPIEIVHNGENKKCREQIINAELISLGKKNNIEEITLEPIKQCIKNVLQNK